MLDLKDQNIIALPLHDSLIVAHSALEATRKALTTAFRTVIGVTPRLKVVKSTLRSGRDRSSTRADRQR